LLKDLVIERYGERQKEVSIHQAIMLLGSIKMAKCPYKKEDGFCE
jgi:hypothetical protein